MDIIKEANFDSILKPLYKGHEVCQAWSSSLYICPPGGNDNSSIIGLHSDCQFTPFIEGDYYVALLPLSEMNYENLVLFEKSFNYEVKSEFLNPLAQNIDEQLVFIENEYELTPSKYNLTKSDLLITHSRCLKGILSNVSDKNCSYFVIYFRNEKNVRRKAENHFGMCDYLDNLLLSPILFCQK